MASCPNDTANLMERSHRNDILEEEVQGEDGASGEVPLRGISAMYSDDWLRQECVAVR